ncbi:MAG: hypothetical protein GY854_13695, partial [Deltaproteobacteria bacterium]|nr:hypothetical protein [Deltaproteobacteria bacterium]
MSDERRQHPRAEASLQVSYKSVAALVQAYSSDISEGGLYLATRKLMPVGTVIALNIALPDEGPELEAIARVVRVQNEKEAASGGRQRGMGMEFLDVGGRPVSDQIAEFLFKRSGEPPTLYAKSGAKGRVLVVDDSEFHLK